MKGTAKGTKAVDVATGRATVEYFFDPTLLIKGQNGETKTPKDTNDPIFFASKHLFVPCSIIKPLDSEGAPVNVTATQNNNKKKKNKNKKGKSPKNNPQQNQPFPGPTLVKTSDGTLFKITDSTKLSPLSSADSEGVHDVLRLPSVSEASLLHTLRLRYRRDDIYTAAGSILISINPYKAVSQNGESIYSEKLMTLYRNNSGWSGTKPPHLFQTADRAYTALMESAHAMFKRSDNMGESLSTFNDEAAFIQNQSIIISGESGAGKTEATKIIMKYLAKITRKSGGVSVATLEERVLSSNPLLESFGNAQTLRNNNSSRFGKFIHIYFSGITGAITGASISNYLLEKTRITHQVDGERNYHIFYQMLSGADAALLKELGLSDGASSFRYLGQSTQNKSDGKHFKETVHCLTSIGLSPDDQTAVFGMAAAVLHLGNIRFEQDDNDAAKVTEASVPSLKKACALLGLDEASLTEAIVTKIIVINGKRIHKPQNVVMAEDKRDALAKMTYSCLFLWLVNCVNQSFHVSDSTAPEQVGSISVLDIYGFESFVVNGFEQLLINYCNEKLQRHFNRHLFETEQELYSNEGVDWSYITFNDNRPCLELIEGGSGSFGILSTLDDAWGGMGNATEKDAKFAKHLHNRFGSNKKSGGHPNFVPAKIGTDRDFSVLHYAGAVKYSVDGFVEKNMETMSNELRSLGETSSVTISKKVYELGTDTAGDGGSATRSSIRGISVGSQFKTSLQSLVTELERTQPHYIRCVKPNPNKAPGSFTGGEVLKQLRYSGMMEAIRIRQEGYALREEHETFFDRFSVLLNPDDIKNTDDPGVVQLVKALSKRLGVTDADWQVGHSKVFLRRDLSEKLERLSKLRVHVAARTLTRFGVNVARRRCASFIVVWVRFRLVMMKKIRLHRAAAKIAAFVRGYTQRNRYTDVMKYTVRIQAQFRRLFALHRARKIKDPYYDLSFRECKKMLASETRRLDRAIKNNSFSLASELEAKIDAIKEVVEKKRPITRAIVDQRILELKEQLEDAMKKQDFDGCGPLQDALEEWTAKQVELPSIAELRSAVSDAEAAMAAAAKKRDFAAAAAAQRLVDKAKKRLSEVVEAEDSDEDDDSEHKAAEIDSKAPSCTSRGELEAEIVVLKLQIEDAIARKDYSKASILQSALEEKEKLRKMFPSVAELRDEISASKTEIDNAVARKDFARAGVLIDQVTEIEQKLAGELSKNTDTESLTLKPPPSSSVDSRFKSRGELELEIDRASELVSKFVEEKSFKKAESMQAELDELTILRTSFPTVEELEQQLQKKKDEMNRAISGKQFSRAEEINTVIETMERKLAGEKASNRAMKPVQNKVAATVFAAKPTGNVPKRRDSASVKSVPVNATPYAMKSTVGNTASSVVLPPKSSSKLHEGTGNRNGNPTVKKLRPAIPLVSNPSQNVLSIAKLLSRKRASASVIVDANGKLSGILTDTDITRRLIAKSLNPVATEASQIMTANPTSVLLSDSATDALTTMIENQFRHLPVVDKKGSVVGLLDIAKCLLHAIAQLEHGQKNSSSTEALLDQALGTHGAKNPQAAAMHALLSTLMQQAFGGHSAPTLRSILAGKSGTIVNGDTSVYETCLLMTENRQAAMVVDDAGSLVGIFGFRDAMARAVAEQLDVQTTPISEVMTPNPEAVSPDSTVLEALQIMHDQRFTTLPVCEEDGTVLGIVGVIDVLFGCGGPQGWRAVFESMMEITDDVSDIASHHSKAGSDPSAKRVGQADKTVAKLRPSKPCLVQATDSVWKVACLLKKKRGTASLVTSSNGSLSGIITDTDFTRRVVAMAVDPLSDVSRVMTQNPTCVSMNDSATDALATMIEHHFRHLPVVDDQGHVVGVLDIAKCLLHAITQLERTQEKSTAAAEDALKQALGPQNGNATQAAAMQTVLGNLLKKAFGDQTVPTLRSILEGKPATLVSPETSVYETGLLMAEHRKAALITNASGDLVGIFGFQDMMTRAIAGQLDLGATPICEVMTANPEAVSPDNTVLEALEIMHDQKFTTLPVCEDNGTVLGVVGVLDVLFGCGGAKGWRAVFASMMEVSDDSSDAGSRFSHDCMELAGKRSRRKGDKTVAKLRPSKPHLSETGDSILTVAQLLKMKRGSSSLIISPDGSLAGILTDTDITRRVVAKSIDFASTNVSDVMTANPKCVSVADSATEALVTMVENHFRHLPVLDEQGSVVGVLDIAKCLLHAISQLELSQENDGNAAEVLEKALGSSGNHAEAKAMKALLGNLMKQAFGNQTVPSLRTIMAGKPPPVVTPHTSIREASFVMATNRKAALVVDDSFGLIGVFGFKDMMVRAVAESLDLDSTPVSEVMTPDPEVVSPEIDVLEALHLMNDQRFLTLPVCEEDGTVVGLVDVMDVIYGCGGAEGWRSIFKNAMDLDDFSVGNTSAGKSTVKKAVFRGREAAKTAPPYASDLPPHIPSTLEFADDCHQSFTGSTIGDERGASRMLSPGEELMSGSQIAVGTHVTFKVTCPKGNTHRIKCRPRIEDVVKAISKKVDIPIEQIGLEYEDDEGDTVVISSDECVTDAWNLAVKGGKKLAKISVLEIKAKSNNAALAVGGGLALIALLGAAAFAILRAKK